MLGFGSQGVSQSALVLDIGTKYTKIGFAGELSPRIIIPSEVTCRDGSFRSLFSYESEEELKLLLVDFIHTIYFRYALVTPKEKQVVVVESLLCSINFKEVLAKVLFCHYEVGKLLFVPSHLVALYPLGIKTALVVDVGYLEAQVIPVYELTPILKAWQAQPIAGQAVERRLQSELKNVIETEKNKSANGRPSPFLPSMEDFTESDIEDIKVRGCFVTTIERGQIFARSEKLPTPEPPALDYNLNEQFTLSIPGHVRESAYEPVFERDNDNLSLPNLILDSILKCGVDIRRALAENILLVGGTTMAPGFKARLKQELEALLLVPPYCTRLSLEVFKFHSPPAKENCVTWLGSAMVAATQVVGMRSLTKYQYLSQGLVPDWSNLTQNELYLSKLTI